MICSSATHTTTRGQRKSPGSCALPSPVIWLLVGQILAVVSLSTLGYGRAPDTLIRSTPVNGHLPLSQLAQNPVVTPVIRTTGAETADSSLRTGIKRTRVGLGIEPCAAIRGGQVALLTHPLHGAKSRAITGQDRQATRHRAPVIHPRPLRDPSIPGAIGPECGVMKKPVASPTTPTPHRCRPSFSTDARFAGFVDRCSLLRIRPPNGRPFP